MSQTRTFFCTGYPRSRTAWFSVAMTHNGSICLHDPCRTNPQFYKMVAAVNAIPSQIRGVSDPILLLFLPEMLKFFPDAKWVIIERNINEAAASFQNAFWGMEFPDWLREKCHEGMEQLKQSGALVVPFSKIDKSGKEIWKHCIGKGFDEERWNRLCELNIQLITNKALQNVLREETMLCH